MTKKATRPPRPPAAPPLPQGVPVDLAAQAFTAVTEAAARGELLGAGPLGDLLLLAERLDGPALLHTAWSSGAIDAHVLAVHVGRVWSMAEYPDAALGHPVWRRLFAAAGYTADGRPARPPAGPVELWRGSVPERRTDWSWTARRAVAEGYATGTGARRPTTGRLYRVLAPPPALLAHNTGRGEDEYVLDTHGLALTEVPLTR